MKDREVTGRGLSEHSEKLQNDIRAALIKRYQDQKYGSPSLLALQDEIGILVDHMNSADNPGSFDTMIYHRITQERIKNRQSSNSEYYQESLLLGSVTDKLEATFMNLGINIEKNRLEKIESFYETILRQTAKPDVGNITIDDLLTTDL